MKIRNTITKLMAVAALATVFLFGAGSLQPVQAQIGDGSVRFISYASVGIVHGEKVRLSVSNTEESTGTLSLSFSYYLAHTTNSSSSVPFYETEWIRVPRGEFRYSEVAREQMKTEGDPLTGRAQMMVKVTMIAPAGSDPDDFPGSLEIIKDGDQNGNSVQIDSKYRLIIVAAKRSKQLAPISFRSGERLSYTFCNPNEEGSQPVSVQAYGYDATGRLLIQTAPAVLLPGQCSTSSINRDDLPVAGEEKTGRLQMGSGIQVLLMDGSVREVKFSVSIERVDNRTGTSSAGTYYTGTVSVSGDGF